MFSNCSPETVLWLKYLSTRGRTRGESLEQDVPRTPVAQSFVADRSEARATLFRVLSLTNLSWRGQGQSTPTQFRYEISNFGDSRLSTCVRAGDWSKLASHSFWSHPSRGSQFHNVPSSRLALSAHNLGALQRVLLIALGLLWSKRELEIARARHAFWCLIVHWSLILQPFRGPQRAPSILLGRS